MSGMTSQFQVEHLVDGSAFSEEEPLRGGRVLVGTFWVLRL